MFLIDHTTIMFIEWLTAEWSAQSSDFDGSESILI